MKTKFVSAVALSVIMCGLCFASNTVYQHNTNGLPINTLFKSPVKQATITVDTPGDVTVETVSSGSDMVCVLGWATSLANAVTVNFKSGSNSIVKFNLLPNQGHTGYIGKDVQFCTAPGQSLVINFSAVADNFLVEYVRATDLRISN